MIASVIAATKAAIIPSFQKCSFAAMSVVLVGGFSVGVVGFFKSVDIKYTPSRETISMGETAVPDNNNMIIG
jgi:hypothetical protein